MARHNIVGCEATDRHPLVAFGHAYGHIRMSRPRARRALRLALTAFAAGAAATIVALNLAAILARS